MIEVRVMNEETGMLDKERKPVKLGREIVV